MASFKLGTKPSQTGGGATTWTFSVWRSGRNQVSPNPLLIPAPLPTSTPAWMGTGARASVSLGVSALIPVASEDVIFAFLFLKQLIDFLESRKIPSPGKINSSYPEMFGARVSVKQLLPLCLQGFQEGEKGALQLQGKLAGPRRPAWEPSGRPIEGRVKKSGLWRGAQLLARRGKPGEWRSETVSAS